MISCLQVQKEDAKVRALINVMQVQKKKQKMFEDETHSEEIPSECVRCKSISPSCKVRGQPKPPVSKVCGQLETTWCDGS
jgi:hypothetical protein